MSETVKINEVTVQKYIEVVNNPDQYAAAGPDTPEGQILSKFRYCARSHQTLEKERKEQGLEPLWPKESWGAFNVILVAFRYLVSDRGNFDDAVGLLDFFGKYHYDEALNPKQKEDQRIYASRAEMFIFGKDEEKKHEHAFFEKPEELDKQARFDGILGTELDRQCTVEDVLQRLYIYIRPEKRAAFREVALRGFDVEDMGTGFEAKPAVTGQLWDDCDSLYQAGARQIVFTGAPGTGKTYTARKFAESIVRAYAYTNGKVARTALESHIATVQFHSSYDYSDFVEGLRPVQVEGAQEMTFVRLDGHFKAFCRKIVEAGEEDVPYFFIIDEINRADLSRVFGDLMFCLDESKRPNKKNKYKKEPVKTQYSNLRTYRIREDGQAVPLPKEKDVFCEGFYIPENLCILATMNDIDRSVESFDFALRRRFKWIAADANAEMEAGLQGMLIGTVPGEQIQTLVQRVIKLNGHIAGDKDAEGEQLRLSSDYHIGHAYFDKFTGDNWDTIWQTQIQQILREYCRGRSTPKTVDAFMAACKAAWYGEDTQ